MKVGYLLLSFVYAGFMCGTTVLDKDGISAFATVCEMTSHLYGKQTSLVQQLANIFET